MRCTTTASSVTLGLVALCAHWFKEVGLQDGGTARTLQADYDRMIRLLSPLFDRIIAPGVISTRADAREAARQFRREKVDALLLVHIMWSEDQPLIAILRGCPGTPLLVWNYHPTGALPSRLTVKDVFRYSGTVGLLQGSAPLQRMGLTATWVAGAPGDANLVQDLKDYAAALRLHREFQGLRAGRIAGRCEVMTGTHAHSRELLKRLGVQLIEISAAAYDTACRAVAPRRVDVWSAELARRYPRRGISRAHLNLACRNALALDDLVARYHLASLAIQDLDPELHRRAGIRPCLYPPLCATRQVSIAMESDVVTGLGLLAGMRAASSPALYTEIFTFDPRANLLLMGHAAAHDPRLAAQGRVTLVPDAEYCRSDVHPGVWQEFILRAGPVTCVSFYDTGAGYRMVVFEGQSLGGPRRIDGFAHAAVRPAGPVAELVTRLVRLGMTQHFAVVPGRIASILRHWCALSGVDFIKMDPPAGRTKP